MGGDYVCSLQAPNCIHHFTNSIVIFSINFDFNLKDLFVSNDPFPVDTYRIQLSDDVDLF